MERKRHPLEITYEEIKRTISRLEGYVVAFGSDIPKELVLKIDNIRSQLEKVVEQIPEQYHVTWYERKRQSRRK